MRIANKAYKGVLQNDLLKGPRTQNTPYARQAKRSKNFFKINQDMLFNLGDILNTFKSNLPATVAIVTGV